MPTILFHVLLSSGIILRLLVSLKNTTCPFVNLLSIIFVKFHFCSFSATLHIFSYLFYPFWLFLIKKFKLIQGVFSISFWERFNLLLISWYNLHHSPILAFNQFGWSRCKGRWISSHKTRRGSLHFFFPFNYLKLKIR